MFLDVDEALRSDIEKQVDSSALFILPKLEDSPISTFPSISVPCKFEPESQELGSMSITDQGKDFRVGHFSQYILISIFRSLELPSLLTFIGIK
jgi:hypothetical protein